eukprot:scaffold98808_cov69-Phaeocystis_antarctica.AAC.8
MQSVSQELGPQARAAWRSRQLECAQLVSKPQTRVTKIAAPGKLPLTNCGVRAPYAAGHDIRVCNVRHGFEIISVDVESQSAWVQPVMPPPLLPAISSHIPAYPVAEDMERERHPARRQGVE